MGIFSFSKSKQTDKSEAGDHQPPVKREPRKAVPWFKRAQDVSATNHDYAIECFTNGFKQDPDNMNMHELLREVSLKRKVSGGKPAGMMEQMKSGGSDSIDKMVHAERLLAMDPTNPKHARDAMKYAVTANDDYEQFNMGEVANWVGKLAMEFNSQAKKPDKAMFLELCELFRTIRVYPESITAAQRALSLSPDDSDLRSFVKDLEAEAYSYAQTDGEEDASKIDFRKNIKDADEQTAIQQDQAVTRTEQMVNEAD